MFSPRNRSLVDRLATKDNNSNKKNSKNNENENGDDLAMNAIQNSTSIPGNHPSPRANDSGADTTDVESHSEQQWTLPPDHDDLGDAEHHKSDDMSSNETVLSLYDPSLELLSPASPPKTEPTRQGSGRSLHSSPEIGVDNAHLSPSKQPSLSVTATPWNDPHHVKTDRADSKPGSTTTLGHSHGQIQHGCGVNEPYHDFQNMETNKFDDVTESSFSSPTNMTVPEINYHALSSSIERNEKGVIDNALGAGKLVDEGCSTDHHASSSSSMFWKS